METSEKLGSFSTSSAHRRKERACLKPDVVWRLVLLLFVLTCIVYIFVEVYKTKQEIQSLKSDVDYLLEELSDLKSQIQPVEEYENDNSNSTVHRSKRQVRRPSRRFNTPNNRRRRPDNGRNSRRQDRPRPRPRPDISSRRIPGNERDVLTTSTLPPFTTTSRPFTTTNRFITTTRGPMATTSRPFSRSLSIFIRWGKASCPGSSTVVYTGYAAAADPWYGMGGSTELECLPLNPEFYPESPTSVSKNTKMFPAKFVLKGHPGLFPPSANGGVIQCAVCEVSRAPVIVHPGSRNCPSGYHKEYEGYMMASQAIKGALYFSSKNYCVDKRPDTYPGHEQNELGFRLTFLQAGSCYQNRVPCQSYTENHRLPCAMCAKSGF